VRIALEGWRAPRSLRGWISFCGLLHGTPEVNRLIEGPWPVRLGTHLVLKKLRTPYSLMRDLRHGPGRLLGQRAVAPAGIRTVCVVGCPLRRHLSRSTRGRHRKLIPHGPSDGSGLLWDSAADGALIVPVWGADHYFRVAGADDLLHGLFVHLQREGVFDEWRAGMPLPEAAPERELSHA
jgi:hypothetical protein